MPAVSNSSWVVKDYSGKKGTIEVHGALLTAGNIAAQATLRTALLTAIQAVIGGELVSENVVASHTKFSNPNPSDPEVWKSKRWLVTMRDTNGNAVTFHIPTAIPSTDYLSPGTNQMDLTSTEGLALKDAIEDFCVSNDSEATVVESIIFVDK